MKRAVRIFVASSSENNDVAHALCTVLGSAQQTAFKVLPAAWDQGTFKLSATYIESLEEELDKADFSVLVLTPNDVTLIRGEEVLSPRDNVLFELGLFMGRLHRERCYMLYEHDDKPKIPSDLLGVKAVTYQKADPAGLEKALLPAGQLILDRVGDILQGEKRSSFVAQIEGTWWERIQTRNGFELSFFTISPEDKYASLHMEGDHFDGQGDLFGHWKSVMVRLLEAQWTLIYHWEGENAPTPHGNASQVQGFGTLEFAHAAGRLEEGKGGFMDVDPNDIVSTAKWKTVRLKRVTDKVEIRTMSKGSLAEKKALVSRVLAEW